IVRQAAKRMAAALVQRFTRLNRKVKQPYKAVRTARAMNRELTIVKNLRGWPAPLCFSLPYALCFDCHTISQPCAGVGVAFGCETHTCSPARVSKRVLSHG